MMFPEENFREWTSFRVAAVVLEDSHNIEAAAIATVLRGGAEVVREDAACRGLHESHGVALLEERFKGYLVPA